MLNNSGFGENSILKLSAWELQWFSGVRFGSVGSIGEGWGGGVGVVDGDG